MRIDISNRIGTTSNFGGFRGLLDKFSGAAAGYSLRKLSKSATNAVRVRRSSDNTEQDIGFTGTELDTTTLLDFVNARDVAPADYGAGAAAAYSLRYVSDSYTGDVVRVRRDSDNAEADFNPTEITDGTLLAWVGNTASDNGYVTTWYDQSGNSNDATQGTAASQPKIVDAGVLVTENGKPALDFDGSDDLRLPSFNLGNKYMLFHAGMVNANSHIFADRATVIGNQVNWRTGNNSAIKPAVFIQDTQYDATNNITLGQQFLLSLSVDLDNDIISHYLDGISNGTNISTVSTSFDSNINFSIGCQLVNGTTPTSLYDGNFQELIIFDSDQSSNRGNIEANVNDYYSIYTSTNDGFVTTWYDQAGSNDATQATAAAQPQIVDGGSLITENGKVAVLLDGTDDHLVSTNAYPTQQYQSTFYVASSTGTNNRILDTRGTGAPAAVQGWHHKYSQTDPTFDITTIDNGSSISLKTTGITRTGQNLVSVFMYGGSGSSINEYTNGSLSDSVTDVNNIDFNSGNDLYIGANVNGANTQLFGGKIQDIILYNSNQSGNRTAIEGNINGHYNIYP